MKDIEGKEVLLLSTEKVQAGILRAQKRKLNETEQEKEKRLLIVVVLTGLLRKIKEEDQAMNTLANQIYDFISDEGGDVTLAAISYKFGSGNVTDESENLVVWGGYTREVFDAICHLFKKWSILHVLSTREAYVKDGFETTLPVHISGEQKPLEELHWIPMSFWTTKQAKQGLLPLSEEHKNVYRELGYDI